MQFRYQSPYLNKNLNTWFKGIVNARYTSKIVCLSFFCKFIKFAHTIQWGFLPKNLFGHFYVFRELFCLFQHILATVQPKIHLNTKFEILPFGWTKCPKTEPFFLKLPICSILWVWIPRVHPSPPLESIPTPYLVMNQRIHKGSQNSLQSALPFTWLPPSLLCLVITSRGSCGTCCCSSCSSSTTSRFTSTFLFLRSGTFVFTYFRLK